MYLFFFSSRRRHTRCSRDWSSDVCSSDLYPGVEPESAPDGERRALGRPYLLTVATLEPRKNLATVVAAHELLEGELALAVSGAAGWGEQPALDAAGILRLGYTPPPELPALYR